MDLRGIPKRAWRARLLECYYTVSKNTYIPRNEVFFTLGGPARAQDSEFNYLTGNSFTAPFIAPKQYVSVERELGIHRSNCRIKGPTWLRGEFSDVFGRWCGNNPEIPVAVCSCDLMCGIVKALPTIRKTLLTLFSRRTGAYSESVGHALPKCGHTLVAFNVCSRRRLHRPNASFPPVWKTIQEDSIYKLVRKFGVGKLIDRFDYANKSVGLGADNTHMETLVMII